MTRPGPPKRSSAAFLLSQVGAHAAARFAERLKPLGLSPPHAGILRVLARSQALSQQQLAAALDLHPSRLVTLVDELESKGVVERRENPDDRRTHALHLTERGTALLGDIGRVARQHDDTICAALDEHEREQLFGLLQRIADEQGLTPAVHPGFSRLGRP